MQEIWKERIIALCFDKQRGIMRYTRKFWGTSTRMRFSKIKNVLAIIRAKEYEPQGQGDKKFRSREDVLSDFKRFKRYPFIIGVYAAVYSLYLFICVLGNLHATKVLDPRYIFTNFFVATLLMVVGLGVWVWSTAYDYWNYYHHKIFLLCLMGFGGIFLLSAALEKKIFYPVVRMVLKIPINQEITEHMVLSLAGSILSIILIAPIVILIWTLLSIGCNKQTVTHLLSFKIMHHIDIRKHKQFLYDNKVITRMEDGRPVVIRQKDRQLHTSISGATGTAKTSSTIIPSIAEDLDHHVYNEEFQKKECEAALKAGIFKMDHEFADEDFSINYFSPVPGKEVVPNPALANNLSEKYFGRAISAQEYYKRLRMISGVAGVTVVAPNSSLADKAYTLAKNRGIKVNRLDPMLKDGKHLEGFIGLNPLYVSPSLTGKERARAITDNANIFADVLQALFDMSGKQDVYFKSVNNSLTIQISKLLMLTFEDLNGRQPNPSDLQYCVNNVDVCKVYQDRLVEKYGKTCKADKPITGFEMITDQDQEVDCGDWQDVYDFVKNDLLSPTMKEKMYDRANGLRLQINNFLNHPYIRDVLCTNHTVDLDMALANGEVTVVNYSLELGSSVSTGFGLFFLFTYAKAILRRPGTEADRVIHFNYIDEFPVLLHPNLEEYFSLHRQYCVANTVAIQTEDQFDKNDMTKYMKGVVAQVGHKIKFGRLSNEEAKTTSLSSGTEMVAEEQQGETMNSITSDRPMHTFSKRRTMKEQSRMSMTDLIYKDFREVTLYTVCDGSLQEPINGIVHFLEPSREKGLPRKKYQWGRYYQQRPAYAVPGNVYTTHVERDDEPVNPAAEKTNGWTLSSGYQEHFREGGR